MFTPLDPDFIAGCKVGRRSVERAQAEFRLIVPKAEKAAAASSAEAAAGEGGDLAVVGKSLTWPDREEDEGGAARFAAIGAVAEADAKRLAFHPVGDRSAKAASGSDLHGAASGVETGRKARRATLCRHQQIEFGGGWAELLVEALCLLVVEPIFPGKFAML